METDTTTKPNPPSGEAESLQLLRELQTVLAGVLNSLGGKFGDGLFEHFIFYSSVHINRAAGGFVSLRETGRLDASKFLVRPAMEVMIKQQAVVRQPELLFRIAYSERMEDRRLIQPSYRRAGKNYDALDQQQWREFSAKYSKQYPHRPREDNPLSLYEMAKAANLESYYNSYYRLYCQITHGAFRVMVGGLNSFDSEDNRTIALCVLGALAAINETKLTNIPDLADLQQKLSNLPS
jgi:hypothetical protein